MTIVHHRFPPDGRRSRSHAAHVLLSRGGARKKLAGEQRALASLVSYVSGWGHRRPAVLSKQGEDVHAVVSDSSRGAVVGAVATVAVLAAIGMQMEETDPASVAMHQDALARRRTAEEAMRRPPSGVSDTAGLTAWARAQQEAAKLRDAAVTDINRCC